MYVLEADSNTKIQIDVSSADTLNYDSCIVTEFACNLDIGFLIFYCSDNQTSNDNVLYYDPIMRTNFVTFDLFTEYYKSLLGQTVHCFTSLDYIRSGNWEVVTESDDKIFQMPPAAEFTEKDLIAQENYVSLALYEYSVLKSESNYHSSWDFKEYLLKEMNDSITAITDNISDLPLFSAFLETSGPIIAQEIARSNISYTCFKETPEKDIEFFFRASSYTFIVSIIFMLVQLVSWFIYAYYHDD